MHGRFAIARTVVLAASFFGMFLNKTKELVVFSLHHLFIYLFSYTQNSDSTQFSLEQSYLNL